MEIRKEESSDTQSIHRLTTDAFAPVRISDGSEPAIIDKLRSSGDLALSLVALENEVLVGHVAFSPVKVANAKNGWYGLGPISVLPKLQRTGIGSSLINEGLKLLQEMNAEGCVLIGDPNYYSRFGFESDGNLHYANLPDKFVQWKSFGNLRPTGQLVFSPAFGS